MKKKVSEAPPWIQGVLNALEVPKQVVILQRAALFGLLAAWSIMNPAEGGPAFQVRTLRYCTPRYTIVLCITVTLPCTRVLYRSVHYSSTLVDFCMGRCSKPGLGMGPPIGCAQKR